MAGNLKTFRKLLRKYKLISDNSRIPGDFQVIAIYCYAADSNFLKALTPPLEEGYVKEIINLYDILLTDGVEKLKCFLAMPLGNLVQKNIIKVGSYIQIHNSKLCFLEGEYRDSHIVQYVFLEAIKIVEYAAVHFPDIGSLQFVESTNYRETENVPLVTGRKDYLYPWVPVIPTGEEWLDNAALDFNDNDDDPQNISLLNDLADDWMRLPRPYPTLLVCITARGILHYYGFNKSDKPHPFLGKFIISDSSSSCMLVVFCKTAIPLYYSATPGTILLIENYSIKKPISLLLPRLRGDAGNLPLLDIEIIAGDHSNIRIVPPERNVLQMQIALLPKVEFSFGNRASLEFAAHESTVDIIGLITHVSIFHRFMYKFGKFFARCYVELIDSSTHLPFTAILYDNGFRFDVYDLHPGQILVATHMKVLHIPDNMMSSFNIRTYVKATHYTEVYTSHGQSSPYVRYPAVTAIASIIRNYPNEVDFLQSNVLRAGGVPTFLRGYKSLEAYKSSFEGSVVGNMIPGAYWKVALDSMIFRERRCVTLGGFIIQIEYCDLQTVDSAIPSYGWSYARGIRSRRTLFVNIKARYRLGSMPPLNPKMNEMLMFPAKYNSDHENVFKAYRQFPGIEASAWKQPTDSEIENFPVLADGYYVVTIASLHYQAILQCVYIPEPSEKPHPSLIDSFSGNFSQLPLQNSNAFLSEPPRYTWDEVNQIGKTAFEAYDKTFVFAIELHRPNTDVFQAHLVRSYVCPPDQIGEALLADIVQ